MTEQLNKNNSCFQTLLIGMTEYLVEFQVLCSRLHSWLSIIYINVYVNKIYIKFITFITYVSHIYELKFSEVSLEVR